MSAISLLSQIAEFLLIILIPTLVFYLAYLVITKAFNDMGFTTIEAILIVFLSFLLGSGLVDRYVGISFANIPLFMHGMWQVGINTGGAIIPIILSLYLFIKNKMEYKKLLLGILIVTIATFFVTYPDPERGIISRFPYWLIPIIFASVVSIILQWKSRKKTAPFAYICGTLGVLIGADAFHLITLLQIPVDSVKTAVIGGASVFDMVFITGILAVILDGVLIFDTKKREKKQNS